MRRQARGHRARGEGKGEVIQPVTVTCVPLSSLDAGSELLQSGFWGEFKQKHGWQAHAFQVHAHAGSFGLLVLTRRLARLFTIAYVPFGPQLDPSTGRGTLLSDLARAVGAELPSRTLFLRFDLPWVKQGEVPGPGGKPRVRKSAADMQPASTVIVDISPEPEAILASMKAKTRYNIRLAQKKGITVTEGSLDDIQRWYALYEETARRDRIGIHAFSYYDGILRSSREHAGTGPRVQLLLAWHEGELLAGNIVAFWKSRAAYLYGASSGSKRNLMPTYALQWEAILRARAAGCTSYDLFGVPPRPEAGHPMYGLYQFKTGFSDQVLERWGTWDVRYMPLVCAAYRAAEAVRMFYYRGLAKKLRGRREPGGA